jgi:hypothetical protein
VNVVGKTAVIVGHPKRTSVPIVPAVPPLRSVQRLRLFRVQSFKSSTKDKPEGRTSTFREFSKRRNDDLLAKPRGGVIGWLQCDPPELYAQQLGGAALRNSGVETWQISRFNGFATPA